MTKQFSVSLQPDDRGMIGRQCPSDECALYFKLKLGTGQDTGSFRCPYCRTEGHPSNFVTPDQLEYARSLVVKDVVEPLLHGFKRDVESSNRNQPRGLIQLKVSVNYEPLTLHNYQERQLETEVYCDSCTLEFSVYGVFASCPCCGQLNALKVLLSSLETATKKLKLSGEGSLDPELRKDFLKDALTGSVSAFDSYGKALMNSRPDTFPVARLNLFQDIEALDGHLQSGGNPSVEETCLGNPVWEGLKWFFQARHIYVHNAGVVDNRFVSKQPALAHMRGRLLPLDGETLSKNIKALGLLSREIDRWCERKSILP